MRQLIFAIALAGVSAGAAAQPAPPATSDAQAGRARAIYKELIEINTTDTPAGSVTTASRGHGGAIHRCRVSRCGRAGPRARSTQAQSRRALPRHRAAGGRSSCWRTSTSSRPSAADWSVDPFTFLEKDGWFYGRGTRDDKGMASQFVANLLRLKQEGFAPDRDIILALTADEEGGELQRRRLAGEDPPRSDRRRAGDQRGRRRHDAPGEVPDERSPGEREGVPGLHASTVTNAGGHSSLPIKDNAIYHLSAALARLAAFEFPVQLNDVTRDLLRAIGAGRSRTLRQPPTCAPWRDPRPTRRLPRACRRRCPTGTR